MSASITPNSREIIAAQSTITGKPEYLKSTNGLLSISSGTTTAPVAVGQTTSNTSAVQLSAVSTLSTNGILVQAMSTNTATVFIGGSGVLTTSGFELQPGQAVPFTVANITSLYVIGANNTDKVCWDVL